MESSPNMIRATGRYRNQKLELDQPLNLREGANVIVEIQPVTEGEEVQWSELGMSRLEEEWDNSEDAIYDDWRTLYGVPPG
jgi:hypothetical protein